MPEYVDSNWYLREWMRHFGKRQAALVNELGWGKGRASKTWNGKIPYRREIVIELARWLGIRPYELLMPPNEAVNLRRLRETAAAIVAEEQRPFEHEGASHGADRQS
jgi:transcriptional regulator with XRE-family HTH domain